jgi:uncharacterized protein (DUF2252 family)
VTLPTAPIDVARFQFGYDPALDRLVLTAQDEATQRVGLQVTRRLTGRLLDALGGLLERASTAARQAPAEFRDDLVLLEHQEAVQAASKAGPSEARVPSAAPSEVAGTKPEKANVPTVLITAIQIKKEEGTLRLIFRNGSVDAATCRIDRNSAHKLIDALSRTAEKADWNLTPQTGWLSKEHEMILVN